MAAVLSIDTLGSAIVDNQYEAFLSTREAGLVLLPGVSGFCQDLFKGA